MSCFTWRKESGDGKQAVLPGARGCEAAATQCAHWGGKSLPQAPREAGITGADSWRWREGYGGLRGNQVKLLKELARENARLKKQVADRSLEKAIMKAGPSDSSKPRATSARSGARDGPAPGLATRGLPDCGSASGPPPLPPDQASGWRRPHATDDPAFSDPA